MGCLQFKRCAFYQTLLRERSEMMIFVEPAELTPSQKQALRDSWTLIKRGMDNLGTVPFISMFDANPGMKDMPMVTIPKEDERYKVVLRMHLFRVISTVEKCMSRLDEPERMKEVLEELGESHTKYDAKVDYVNLLGFHLFMTMKNYAPIWTEETEVSWRTFVFIIVFHIKKAWSEAKSSQELSKANRHKSH